MNVLKVIFSIGIVFFSLSFFLICGWGIIALFYAIAYLILLLTKSVNSGVKTKEISNQLFKLSEFIVQKEMLTEDEFNIMRTRLLN